MRWVREQGSLRRDSGNGYGGAFRVWEPGLGLTVKLQELWLSWNDKSAWGEERLHGILGPKFLNVNGASFHHLPLNHAVLELTMHSFPGCFSLASGCSSLGQDPQCPCPL